VPVSLPDQLQVGDWEVRPREGIAKRGDETIEIRPRAMDVLVYLASKPGVVIKRAPRERPTVLE
jgi:DNA-binding winged helix-turn-helix (wHTH) protein